jgi:fumarate hydratase subunit alpha
LRLIPEQQIYQSVVDLIQRASYDLEEDIYHALSEGITKESSNLPRSIMEDLVKNADIAKEKKIPLCQDTGFAVFFVEIGVDCYIEGNINTIINQATRDAYQTFYLRKSIIADPLNGKNTQDNTPAVIWIDYVEGNELKITFCQKGGGAENMSTIRMFKPTSDINEIKEFIVSHVISTGGNACPPLIIGIGIGGTMEKCAFLAKKALFRNISTPNLNPFYADLEQNILRTINEKGQGAQGLGGNNTALAVLIEPFARHIASLPVAINLQCHSSRHKSCII